MVAFIRRSEVGQFLRAFFFQDGGQRLFGFHHRPPPRTRTGRGVVLCPPFGKEHLRAHRSYRQLASLLSRGGFDVLRFDYAGTGDSSGEEADATIECWVENILSATRVLGERAELTGTKSMSLVGLRLGATLAYLAATRMSRLDRLVLWDPTPSGKDFLAELYARQREWLEKVIRQFPVDTTPYRRALQAIESMPPADGFETSGFQVGAPLARDLGRLDLVEKWTRADARRVLLMTTTDSASARTDAFTERLSQAEGVEIQHRRARAVWRGAADSTVPGELLRDLAMWIREEAA